MQPTREPMTRAGAHVLAVDDDELVRAVLVRLLDHLGYRTTTAASAAEALDALGSHDDIALLVTDVRLAGHAAGRSLEEAGDRLADTDPELARSLYALALRIAPVKTIGFSVAIERVARYADSSMVSVPCVTTTPSIAGSSTSASRRPRSAHCRSTVMCGPGWRPHSSTRSVATRSMPRAAATISSAPSAGTAPPIPASNRIEIVPPVKTRATTRTGRSRH